MRGVGANRTPRRLGYDGTRCKPEPDGAPPYEFAVGVVDNGRDVLPIDRDEAVGDDGVGESEGVLTLTAMPLPLPLPLAPEERFEPGIVGCC